MRRRSDNRRLVVAVLAAAVVALGGYGLVRYARWRHEQDKEDRLAAVDELIWKHARATALPTELVRSVIRVESGGNPRAVSPKSARGLMQITPICEEEVLRRTGWDGGDLFDPDYNIRLGTWYLRWLIDQFDGDVHLALAAYHRGPTAVRKLVEDHPGLSSMELLSRHAKSSARYCRAVLRGKALRLEAARSGESTRPR